MKQEITAQVVMLPTGKKTWDRGQLLRATDKSMIGIATSNHITGTNDSLTPQHLYFTTDEPIQGGDYFLKGDVIIKCIIHLGDLCYQLVKGSSIWYLVDLIDDKKVVCCTDPALCLPTIPTTWIRDVYVPSNGSIKEVKLEQDFREILDWDCIGGSWQVKLTSNNEVVIVDEAMDIFEKVVDGYVSHEEGLKQLKQMQTEQELEDAANKAYPINPVKIDDSLTIDSGLLGRKAFKVGANWQKEQSATDAIEFAKWTQQNDWWYIDKHDYWMEGKWFDTELERFPSYTSKQLYELWQQSKKK